MKTKTKYQNDLYIGRIKRGCVMCKVYLAQPRWIGNWYWSFDNLETSATYLTHIEYQRKEYVYDKKGNILLSRRLNIYDTLKKIFGDTLAITDVDDLWRFSDLLESYYTLKKTAELFVRGCSNYTTIDKMPLSLMDMDSYKKINEVLIPSIFDAMYDILMKYQK